MSAEPPSLYEDNGFLTAALPSLVELQAVVTTETALPPAGLNGRSQSATAPVAACRNAAMDTPAAAVVGGSGGAAAFSTPQPQSRQMNGLGSPSSGAPRASAGGSAPPLTTGENSRCSHEALAVGCALHLKRSQYIHL